MSIVNWYLFRQVGVSVILVTLLLLGVVWLTQSLSLIDMIVNHGLSLGNFLQITVFLLPSFLLILLPASVFLAVMFVYARLETDREIVVIRSAGLSSFQILSPALTVAVIVMAIAYAISLYLMPVGYRNFKERQFELRNDLAALLVREGQFRSIGSDITVYVRERSPTGVLRGLMLYDSRDDNARVTMTAERGALIATPQGPRFVLEGGSRQVRDIETGRLSILYFDRYVVDLSQFVDPVSGNRWRNADERYIPELFEVAADPAHRHLAAEYRVAAHQRLSQPLYTLAFAMIAGAAILGGHFSRRGRSQRLMIGAAAFASVLIVSNVLPSFAVDRPILIPSLYLAPVLIVVLSLLFIGRPMARQPAAVPG